MKKIIKTAVNAGSIIFTIIKFLFNVSGVRSIWLKFWPGKPGAPPTGPLWLIGIYIALFGIASQRYENRINIIENRANLITSQLNSPQWKEAIARIPSVQKMACPIKPEVLNPVSVFNSITSESYYWDMLENLKEMIELKKDSLSFIVLPNVNLSLADLPGADLSRAELFSADLSGAKLTSADLTDAYLSEANLSGADLTVANLSKAYLSKADLSEAVLTEANLFEAVLSGANLAMADLPGAYLTDAYLFGANLDTANLSDAYLSGANLAMADLSGADLTGADLSGAELTGADLSGAIGLTKEQLLRVGLLYKVEGLDEDLRKQLEDEKPSLFEKPDYIEYFDKLNEDLKRRAPWRVKPKNGIEN